MMTAETMRWLIGILAPPVLGFFVWLVMTVNRLKNELDALKLHIAEEYVRQDTSDKIFRKLDELSVVVYEIAGSLKIPVKRDRN